MEECAFSPQSAADRLAAWMERARGINVRILLLDGLIFLAFVVLCTSLLER